MTGGEDAVSIQTATDLIMDVVRAADPAAAQKAQARLETASVRSSGAAAATPAFKHEMLASAAGLQQASHPAVAKPATDPVAETYQRFEAMILQNFIGAMLPKDSEELYGKGTAGEIWKGMMAEQLGAVLAKGGGIGIADRMLADRIGIEVAPEPEGDPDSNVTNRAANLVSEMQMRILSDVAGPQPSGNNDADEAQIS